MADISQGFRDELIQDLSGLRSDIDALEAKLFAASVIEPTPPPDTRVYETDPYGQATWLYESRPSDIGPDPINGQAVSDLVNVNRLYYAQLTDGGETPPVYVASASDPFFTIAISGHALNGYQVRAPMNMRSGGGADYPLIVLDPYTRTEARFWQARIDNFALRITASSGGLFDYGPYGDGTPFRGNGVGCGLSYLPGLIRRADWERGEINHALRFATRMLGTGFRFPATRTDQGSQPYNVLGAVIPMGARFYLDITPAECDARTAPNASAADLRLLRMICHALREHGMYAADGGGGVVLYMENEITAKWSTTGLTRRSGTFGWMIRPRGTLGGGQSATDGIPWDRLVMRKDA